MSARAKSPGRITCDNAVQATILMRGVPKKVHVLTMLLPSLLIHGDNFITVFADFLTSPNGDNLSNLSAEARTTMYTGSKVLSSEMGKLCLAQVSIMEKLWTSTSGSDRSKPMEDSVLRWLASPAVAKFVTVDKQIVQQFADFLILSESWKDASKKLLGETKNTVHLAMVHHLYGGTPTDTDAGEQVSFVSKFERGVDRFQNFMATVTKKGKAEDGDDSDEKDSDDEKKKQDSYWHATFDYILSWVWFIIKWAPTVYMYFEVFCNLANHAELNFFENCKVVHTTAFAERVLKHRSLMPIGVAWISILWRKLMNARQPLAKGASCTAMVVLLFFGAFQRTVHVIPVIRCGLMAKDKTVVSLYLPTWIYFLVIMYCAEIIYCIALWSRVRRNVAKRSKAHYTPVYTTVVACYTAMTYLDRKLENPPFLRFIFVLMCVAMGLDPQAVAQHKDKHWNCQWTSFVVAHAVCLLLVSYEMGLCPIPNSVHPELLKRVIDAVGSTHLELYAYAFVYTCIDFVWPAEQVEIDN